MQAWSVSSSSICCVLESICGNVIESILHAYLGVSSQAGWECIIGCNWECSREYAWEWT